MKYKITDEELSAQYESRRYKYGKLEVYEKEAQILSDEVGKLIENSVFDSEKGKVLRIKISELISKVTIFVLPYLRYNNTVMFNNKKKVYSERFESLYEEFRESNSDSRAETLTRKQIDSDEEYLKASFYSGVARDSKENCESLVDSLKNLANSLS